MKQRILAALAAAFALAACSEKPAPKPAAPAVTATPAPAAQAPVAKTSTACTGTCDVNVTIAVKPDKSCEITSPLTSDVINVGRSQQPTIIKWTIQNAPGFKFDSPNGIAFDKGNAPPSTIMQNGAGGAPVVTVTDNHKDESTKGRWRYSIYVTDGSAKCKLDPDIDNN